MEIYILPYENAHMKNTSTVLPQIIFIFFSWKLLHLSSRTGWAHTKDYKMQELSSLRAQIPWMHSEVTCDCFFHPATPLLSPKQWLGEAQFTCGTYTEILVPAGVPLPFQHCFRRSRSITDLTRSNKGTTNSPTSFGILSSTWSCFLKFIPLKRRRNWFSISQIAILLPSAVKTSTLWEQGSGNYSEAEVTTSCEAAE